MNTPPPIVGNARVVEFAVIDRSIKSRGDIGLFVGGKPVGRVPGLAICEDIDSKEILLLHCTQRWRERGVQSFKSLHDAKARAERAYPGVAAKWRKRKVSRLAARRLRDKEWANLRCSFCGRIPIFFQTLFSAANGARICDDCVRGFGKKLLNTPRRRDGVA